MQAIWSKQGLVDLNILTFNGKALGWRNVASKRAYRLDEPWDAGLAQSFSENLSQRTHVQLAQLRPMKLLPAGWKLRDLGNAPWMKFDQGSNFFDLPPNFSAR